MKFEELFWTCGMCGGFVPRAVEPEPEVKPDQAPLCRVCAELGHAPNETDAEVLDQDYDFFDGE